MSTLTIVKPLPIPAYFGTATAAGNALTPDPKEVWQVPADGNNYFIDLDLGAALPVDSLFIGYHNAVSTSVMWAVQTVSGLNGTPGTTVVPSSPLLTSSYLPSHASMKVSPAVTSRYLRFFVNNPTSQPVLTIGLISLGLAFQPVWGHEFGAGRPIIDTGAAERLVSGGFGINPGKIVGGYQWQFGDIQPAELPVLYDLLKRTGNTNPVWVVENPDQTVGLNERTHYGLFTKIDVYERIDPNNTRYALQMEEWA